MMKGVITVAHLVNGFGAAGCLSPLSKAPAETNVCVCVRALWELPTTESVSECITGVVGLVSFLLLTHSLLAADWRDLATYRRFTKRPHRADWVKCTYYISLSLSADTTHTHKRPDQMWTWNETLLLSSTWKSHHLYLNLKRDARKWYTQEFFSGTGAPILFYLQCDLTE